ncbi:hypothetical protein [Marinivivus vitaminiproducens]|uniref:hypothetical protein n=1 Tax=Marinivivus vitaminiproducens TaxID=3035935 RepID=UPI00279B010B|nr:hypothetical protein P4R82_12605 [Geminicoccaceae bacterium SCSIO 64248]
MREPPPVREPDYIAKRASVFVALILAAILGPLGVVYASVPGAIVLSLLALLVLPFDLIISFGLLFAIFVWPLGLIWAGIAAARRKRLLRAEWRRANYNY